MLEKDRGNLHIGLYLFQEKDWIKAIKEYGDSILDKSILTQYQKKILLDAAKKELIIDGEKQQAKLSFYND